MLGNPVFDEVVRNVFFNFPCSQISVSLRVGVTSVQPTRTCILTLKERLKCG